MGEASNGMTGKLDGETFDRGRFDGLKFGRERKDRKVYLFTNTHTLYIYILVYFLSFWGCLLQKGGNSGSLTLH